MEKSNSINSSQSHNDNLRVEKASASPLSPGRGDGGEVELRSEEVQEVMGAVPPWILRSGITLLACIVAMLIIGSWLFKYPQIITTPLVLTTTVPPAGLVAKTSGKIITLNVRDQQKIKAGDCLAILENPAKYEDILYLKSKMGVIRNAVNQEQPYHSQRKELALGNLQGIYSAFLLNLENYNQFIKLNYYPQKIQSMQKLIAANRLHYKSMMLQKEIVGQQHELEKKAYNREAYLRKQNLVSEEESDKAKSSLLQSDLSVHSMRSTLENMQLQISQMEDNLLDIQEQYADKKSNLYSQLKANLNQLETEIKAWEMNYLLVSPIAGKVTFTNYWTVHQNVTAGDVVFTVVPEGQKELVGKAQLPIASSGKVKAGQSVNIHFNNYPDNEFGMVVGKIRRISLIPTKEGNYIVEVAFPKGLTTTYGKKLTLSQEMTANADIITDDLRLIEQFIQPVKKIFKNNL